MTKKLNTLTILTEPMSCEEFNRIPCEAPVTLTGTHFHKVRRDLYDMAESINGIINHLNHETAEKEVLKKEQTKENLIKELSEMITNYAEILK